ncbi:MAG: major capsid protein [Pseudomonadota bacterium]
MGPYSTTRLIQARKPLDMPTAFIRDRFFGGGSPILFETDEIAFDKLKMRRKLAPFVSPTVPGRARKPRGRQVETFVPAYVKPKHEISPEENFVRSLGEEFNGDRSPEIRYAENVVQRLSDQEWEITRTEEWMCCQAWRTGAIVVDGEDYETQTIDYSRDSSLTNQLATTARWGEAGVKPLNDLRLWAKNISTIAGGNVTDVVMGPEATAIFQADADVREILDNRRQAGGQVQMGPIVTGGQDMVAQYIGFIGQFDFWQYSQKFEDEAGNLVDFWPEYGVGLVAPGQFDGMMAYGAIKDNRALRAMRRFPKMWEQDDPSADFLMTQSAPLPVPGEVNASAYIEVR